MLGVDLSFLEQIRVSEQWTSHNDLHTAKDYIILTLFEYLKLQAQTQWYYLTSAKERGKIEPEAKPPHILNPAAPPHVL